MEDLNSSHHKRPEELGEMTDGSLHSPLSGSVAIGKISLDSVCILTKFKAVNIDIYMLVLHYRTFFSELELHWF